MVAFFVEIKRTRRKLDRVGAMTFFFSFGDQPNPKILAPPKDILPPLEQRSSWSTGETFSLDGGARSPYNLSISLGIPAVECIGSRCGLVRV